MSKVVTLPAPEIRIGNKHTVLCAYHAHDGICIWIQHDFAHETTRLTLSASASSRGLPQGKLD